MVEAALRYARRGWSAVPCGRDKRPLVSWLRWQSERADEAQVRDWWTRWPEANVGIVTGAVSGIVVLDLDRGHAEGVDGLQSVQRAGAHLPPTPCVNTPSGGLHVYFRHPGRPVPNATALLPGVDLRGDGGYVVAPPSTTDAGQYAAVEQTRKESMADLPDWVARRRTVDASAMPADEWAALWSDPCTQGQRNSTAARLAGHLAARGIAPQEAQALLCMWAESRCDPPLDDAEIASTVLSVYRVDARRHPERATGTGRRGEFWWRDESRKEVAK